MHILLAQSPYEISVGFQIEGFINISYEMQLQCSRAMNQDLLKYFRVPPYPRLTV